MITIITSPKDSSDFHYLAPPAFSPLTPSFKIARARYFSYLKLLYPCVLQRYAQPRERIGLLGTGSHTDPWSISFGIQFRAGRAWAIKPIIWPKFVRSVCCPPAGPNRNNAQAVFILVQSSHQVWKSFPLPSTVLMASKVGVFLCVPTQPTVPESTSDCAKNWSRRSLASSIFVILDSRKQRSEDEYYAMCFDQL